MSALIFQTRLFSFLKRCRIFLLTLISSKFRLAEARSFNFPSFTINHVSSTVLVRSSMVWYSHSKDSASFMPLDSLTSTSFRCSLSLVYFSQRGVLRFSRLFTDFLPRCRTRSLIVSSQIARQASFRSNASKVI